MLNRKVVQKEDSNICSVLFSCSAFLFATGGLCCRTSLMAVHPQSGCVGSGGMAALCCGSFPEDGAGRVAAGLSCDSVRWGLSPCLSVRGDQGWGCCLQQVFPSAHRGSVPEPGTRWQHWAAFRAGERGEIRAGCELLESFLFFFACTYAAR